jgi:hypothetical protein
VQSEVIATIEAGSDCGRGTECKLELKICERCGGLWLRPAGSRWIYCGPCKVKVDDLPPVNLNPKRRSGRHDKNARAMAPRTERVQ